MPQVRVTWAGEHRFDAGRPDGPVLRLDASGATGQSPVDALLSALASCASADVVDILAKRRTPVQTMSVEVEGERVDTTPRRFKHITLHFRVAGTGIERVHAERAIELSLAKYCSVRESLRPDIPVEWTLELFPSPTA